MCSGVSKVRGCKRNARHNLSCLLQTYCDLSNNEILSVSRQFFETYGVISYGSGWRKDVVNQCLEFASSMLRGTLHGTAQHSVAQ